MVVGNFLDSIFINNHDGCEDEIVVPVTPFFPSITYTKMRGLNPLLALCHIYVRTFEGGMGFSC